MKKYVCALLSVLIAISGMAFSQAYEFLEISINGISVHDETLVSIPVDAVNPSVEITWTGTEGMLYGVQLTNDDGSTIVSMIDVAQTTVNLDDNDLEFGPVYTLQVGTVSDAGRIASWHSVQFTLVESDRAHIVEPPLIQIDRETVGNELLAVDIAGREKGIELHWSAEGQVRAFCVDITDADGNTVVSMADVYIMTLLLELSELKSDMTYVIRVGAVPVSDSGETVWSEASFFTRSGPEMTLEPIAIPTPEPTAESTQEPTAEPTPEPIIEPTSEPSPEPIIMSTLEPTLAPIDLTTTEPTMVPEVLTPAPVGAPCIWIDGVQTNETPMVIEADGRMADITIQWQATGDIRGYNVQMTDAERHTLVSLVNTELMEVRFEPSELEIGTLYSILVEAVPMDKGGSELSKAEFILQSASMLASRNDMPILNQNALSHIERGQITRIYFVDTLSGAPDGAWDVSEDGDGTVLAWTSETSQGVLLTIAGQGGVQTPVCMDELFADCGSVEEIQFNGLIDTSQTTSMRKVFLNCTNLKTLDLSGWVTNRVTDMNGMFEGCENLKYVVLSGWNTDRVIDMQDMFKECISLQFLDSAALKVPSVQNLGGMFKGCATLKSLDLSGFVTARGRQYESMFAGCEHLTQVIVGEGFALLDVEEAARLDLFADCPAKVVCEGQTLAADVWLESVCVVSNQTKGDRGVSVKWVQLALQRLGYLKGAADGIFGNQTHQALIDYQRATGLAPSGIADPDTMRALCVDVAGVGADG